MKIRSGFVSNSSTSSFFCFGVSINLEDIDKLLGPSKIMEPRPNCTHKFDRTIAKFCPLCGSPAWEEIDEDTLFESRLAELEKSKFLKDNKLDYIYGEGETCERPHYIGIDLQNAALKGEKAAAEILRVSNLLKEKLNKLPGFFSDVWDD